jgi:hypothetical protein
LKLTPEKVPMSLISLFVLLSLFFCNVAGAEVYDDFNSGSIEAAKWMIRNVLRDAPGLFTQAGGRLLFSCDRDTGESLVSTRSFTAGFFRIAFHDFRSTNNSPPAQGKGSFAAIGLGPRSNYVRMLRGRVSTGGYMEVAPDALHQRISGRERPNFFCGGQPRIPAAAVAARPDS